MDSQEYNPLVCHIAEKDDISWVKLQSKLLNYERRLEQLNVGITTINLGNPAAHYVKSNNPSNKNQNQYHSGGRFGNNYRGVRTFRGRGNKHGGNNRPLCQVCGKIGHAAAIYFYRFDKNYMGALPDSHNKNQHQHSVFLASNDSLPDLAWYMNSNASSHVTNDANNIQNKQEYHGKETLTAANGQGTGKTLLQGKHKKGLYQIESVQQSK